VIARNPGYVIVEAEGLRIENLRGKSLNFKKWGEVRWCESDYRSLLVWAGPSAHSLRTAPGVDVAALKCTLTERATLSSLAQPDRNHFVPAFLRHRAFVCLLAALTGVVLSMLLSWR
jgi:hypothetical protein